MPTFKNPTELANAIVKEPTNEDFENDARKKFGVTPYFKNATYMLSNGDLLDGSYGVKENPREDHRYINDIYFDRGIEFPYLSDYMRDFMKRGNLRVKPEVNAIELMTKPTDKQMNAIYRLYRLGKIDNLESDGEYLEDIQNERQIADFIRKHYN